MLSVLQAACPILRQQYSDLFQRILRLQGINNAYLGTSVLFFKHFVFGCEYQLQIWISQLISLFSAIPITLKSITSVSNVLVVNHFNMNAGLQYEQWFGYKHRLSPE